MYILADFWCESGAGRKYDIRFDYNEEDVHETYLCKETKWLFIVLVNLWTCCYMP